MKSKAEHIMHLNRRKTGSPVMVFLSLAFLFLLNCESYSQVINNYGAAISLTNNVFMSSRHFYNIAGGDIFNNGTINLSGDYSSTSTTGGNGTFTLMGNWTHSAGLFTPGASTVLFNGADNQLITHPGETFFNLSVSNTGAAAAKKVTIANNITVQGTLSMSLGNIEAGTFILYLSNPLANSLNYTSTTGSRIFGKFERQVGETGNYLFPLGASYYNPANLRTNTAPSAGTILSEFFNIAPTGGVFPIKDPPVEISRPFTYGYWNLTARSGFASGNFNVNLRASGFIDSIHDDTRVIKRITGGNWEVDGTHVNADTVNSIVYRNNLTDGISGLGTQFALGRARPLIIKHPRDTTVCEDAFPFFKVIATGTPALKYKWYKVSTPADIEITNGAHYAGARTDSLTIRGAVLADTGYYYAIVTDRHKNFTRTDSAHLTVQKIPRAAIVLNVDQNHECSNINFDPITPGLTYWDNVTTYLWTRNNPSGITSSMPMSGSNLNFGDVITGSFTNLTDAPIKVTFLITPVGPTPRYCVGNPVPATVTVNPTPRVIPINVKPAICNNGSTEITLTTPTSMTKGAILFDYTVSLTGGGTLTGETTARTNLNPGYKIVLPYVNSSDTIQSVYYTVTPKASDGTLGCVYDSIRIPQVRVHPRPLQDFYISTPFLCEGASDGALTAELSKGSKPDIIKWERPWLGETTYTTTANTDILPVRYVGNYRVTVRDELGCSSVSSYILVSGAILDSYMYVKEKTNTFGTTCPESSDGELWIKETSGSTGIAPFVYSLIYNGTDTIVESDTLLTKESFNYYYNLRSGYYRLYLQDANGCYNVSYPGVEIIPPQVITVEFEKYEYPGTGNYNISCLAYSDGSVRIDSISGGSGGYKYKWTTISGTITGADTLDHLDNITAGKYYLTTTDLMGCVKVDSVTLTEPVGMILSDTLISNSADGNYNISCNGGNDGFINLTITGGSGNYLYSWTGPGGYTATTEDISGLKAGTYTCIVTDVNGCILTPNLSFDLTEPAALNITSVPSLAPDGSNNINCYGGTGSVDITITGGSAGNPYKYTWSTTNGSGLVDGSDDQTALSAGTYHLVVTDLNNCVATTDITLAQPTALGITLVPTHITCVTPGFANGSIDATVTGGVLPYNYTWSNGASGEDISGLTSGYYNVMVTDVNGCQIPDTALINMPPDVLFNKVLSDFDGYNASCYGSSDATININMTSGLAPFSFSWAGPGGYSSTDQYITGLAAGPYTLLITDANACTATEVITVTRPGRLSMNITLSEQGGYNINCAGDSTGTIGIVPVNNVGNVRYLWSDGLTSTSRSGLPAGDYGMIITDSNGCLADTTITLTQPDTIKITHETTLPLCPDKPDGEIRLTVTGGVVGTDYTYRWSDNSTTATISDLYSGLYSVTVSDMNGCLVTDTINLEPVKEACLEIPNAISPNGDLINDYWNIGQIDIYPEAEIKVFNRWGEIIWRSEKGYPQPWDGRTNGRLLPVDSYHYVIDLHNGSKPIVGNITIVR
ncbi:MAG: gliding motility-associated C-terminal domain-containing protein [Bacteroidia bacterium]|nr:gliding motility-associated C-terminal domain-containing protein [Bacteroidia bacterium]